MKLRNFQKVLLPCFLACALFANILNPYFVSAANNNRVDPCDPSLGYEVLSANGCDNAGGTNENDFPNLIIGILNSVITISGLVAVVFIIIGGLNLMTSAGDSEKAKKARNTILYAVIGLIICAIAFAIINFVISGVLQPSITGETV